ncbi:hypothetical protein DL96DRAFT_1826847 [Flagelloscypha sp. PMI_526]|nr:hypothetical protein DL96DRAFT_1826847 [Flagelloscypha sp. PMI_526]
MVFRTPRTAQELVPGSFIDDTLGSQAIAFGVSCVLFGILSIQVLLYFRVFSGDTMWVRNVVMLVWILEFVDQCIIGKATYYYTVTMWGNLVGLVVDKPLWAFILQQTFGSIVGTIIKIVFTVRIWRFSNRNYFVTGLNAIIVLVQFALGMVYTKRAFDQNTFLDIGKLMNTANEALAFGAAADFLVAVTLTWYFSRLKTGYTESDNSVNKLILYGLGTGAISGFLGLLTLVLYNVRTQSFMHVASFIALSKVLAISLMASLNTRKRSTSGSAHQTPTDVQQSMSTKVDESNIPQAPEILYPLVSMGQIDRTGAVTVPIPAGTNLAALESGFSPILHVGPGSKFERLEPNRAVFSTSLSQ